MADGLTVEPSTCRSYGGVDLERVPLAAAESIPCPASGHVYEFSSAGGGMYSEPHCTPLQAESPVVAVSSDPV